MDHMSLGVVHTQYHMIHMWGVKSNVIFGFYKSLFHHTMVANEKKKIVK